MSYFFGDSFDLYGWGGDYAPTNAAGFWDSWANSTSYLRPIVGRFPGSMGAAFTNQSSNILVKSSGVNDAVHHFNFAIENGWTGLLAPPQTNCGWYVTLYDGATAQCTFAFRNDGALVLFAGAVGGTILATMPASLALSQTLIWYAFEVEIVIHPTAGSITVRRNGNPVNDFQATGLNTRASANSYANKIALGCQTTGITPWWFDDFLWRSDAASVAWAGDVRCYCRRPNADMQALWTRSGAFVQQPFSNSITGQPPSGTGSSLSTGSIRFALLTSTGGSISAINFTLNTGFTGNVKMALYNAGPMTTLPVLPTNGAPYPFPFVPTTVIQASNPLANPVAGVNSVTFSPPVVIPKGAQYFAAIATDTSFPANDLWQAYGIQPFDSNAVYVNSGAPYATFPQPNPPLYTNNYNYTPFLTPVVTPSANADSVADTFIDYSAGYVSDANVGDADFYSLQAAPSPPGTILGVITRGLLCKNDGGARSAAVQLKSGASTVQSTSTALLTLWGWQWRADVNDPATGAAWTATGVNSAQIGPIVTA